jgi:hypothetical protein
VGCASLRGLEYFGGWRKLDVTGLQVIVYPLAVMYPWTSLGHRKYDSKVNSMITSIIKTVQPATAQTIATVKSGINK